MGMERVRCGRQTLKQPIPPKMHRETDCHTQIIEDLLPGASFVVPSVLQVSPTTSYPSLPLTGGGSLSL